MEAEWLIEVEGESDMEDDEEEIRQLDAVLEEADIEFCETTSVGSPDWQRRPTPTPSIDTNLTLSELSEIDSILALNRLYDEKLRRLERILGIRLQECRTKLNEVQSSNTTIVKQETFRYVNCGRPYFRDQSNYPAPDNEDTIMAKSQMYDFSLVTSVPGWTVRDKNQFTDVMTKISVKMRKQEINDKILQLRRSLVDNPSKSVENEISKLRKERNNMNTKMPFVQLALPLDQEYDWDMLSNVLNKRHTAHEYCCLWKLYFHPSINKSTWKSSEHNQLQTIASSHNYQDWEEIARQLNTGRTGYQCFVYYRTNMTTNSHGKKWTHEEISYLKRLIEYFKEDCYIPWGKIAAAMEHRTKIQIYNKYFRLIEQRKGRFLPEEDAVILNCVERFGTNFKKINEYLAHRSMVQIRSRYQVLNKMRISTVWSVEDDKKLIQVMSNQDPNMNFSTATKFFPGRNRINIRSRYITLKRWMKKYPNADIEFAPRRGARRLNHGQASDDLNKAIENLKNTLHTEVEVKKDRKKITRDSDEVDIEDAIVAALVNEAMREQEIEKRSVENSLVLPNVYDNITNKKLDATNLRKCLIFLNSNLSQLLYNKSEYSKEYPNLGDATQDVNLYKVKSYSKKETVVTIKLNNSPDIWGNNALSVREHVLPPHYATITGCKSLMAHVTTHSIYSNAIKLSHLIKRNALFKEQMEQLIERFHILFLWPMLLSNEGPNELHDSKLSKVNRTSVKQPLLPDAPEITIKFHSFKKFKNPLSSEVIDISEDKDKVRKKITIPETSKDDNIGNYK